VVIPDGNIKTINQAIEKYFFLFLKCFLIAWSVTIKGSACLLQAGGSK